ncbi:MAG: hypothetical protein AAF633_19215 [Chloroflexota bacterium]
MITRSQPFFKMIGRGPMILIALVLFFIGNGLILPQVARFGELTGGTGLLELPNLVGQSLYAIAQTYPDDAVELYQRVIQPLDIVYPLTAGLLFASIIAWACQSLFPSDSRWQFLPWLGLLATLFDWLENLGVFIILRTLDNPIPGIDQFTQLMILLKNGVGVIAIGTILVLLIMKLARWARSR